MTGLKVRIEDGRTDDWRIGIPVTIRSRREASAKPRAKQVVAAPVGRAWSETALEPGAYTLQAVLPSGEILSAEVVVTPGHWQPVVLRRDPDDMGSARPAYDAFPEVSVLGMKTLVFAAPEGRSRDSFTFSLGQGAQAPSALEFDPARWDDWRRWLTQRAVLAAAGGKAELDLPLMEADSALVADWAAPAFDPQGEAPVLQVRRAERGRFDPKAVGLHRQFLTVRSAAGRRLFSLPWPWADGGGSDLLFEVQLAQRQDRLLCETALRDARFGSLIAYLNAGRIGRAGQLLSVARDALFEKWDNPLAAAAGGYVLLSTADSEAIKAWPDWLGNLADRFEHLPDGAILRARWLLETDGDVKTAHDLLVTAFERGIPFYSAGVAWLIEGLRKTAIDCPGCQPLLDSVRGVARFIDFSQVFTTFDLPAADSAENVAFRAALGAPGADGQIAPAQPWTELAWSRPAPELLTTARPPLLEES